MHCVLQVCLAGAGGGYTCQCEPGYRGKRSVCCTDLLYCTVLGRCEYLTTVQLTRPTAFVQLEPLLTTGPLNLTLEVLHLSSQPDP